MQTNLSNTDMKRKILNIFLILVVVAALVWCAVSNGLQWFIGFIPLVWAVISLLKLNTNYITHY